MEGEVTDCALAGVEGEVDTLEEVDGFLDGELTGVDGVIGATPAEVHGVVDGALTVGVDGPVAKLVGVDGDVDVGRTGTESMMDDGPCCDEFCVVNDAEEFRSGEENVEDGYFLFRLRSRSLNFASSYPVLSFLSASLALRFLSLSFFR